MYHVVSVGVTDALEDPPRICSKANLAELRDWSKGIESRVGQMTFAMETLFSNGWLCDGGGGNVYHFQHPDVWTKAEAESRLCGLGLCLPITARFVGPEEEIPF